MYMATPICFQCSGDEANIHVQYGTSTRCCNHMLLYYWDFLCGIYMCKNFFVFTDRETSAVLIIFKDHQILNPVNTKWAKFNAHQSYIPIPPIPKYARPTSPRHVIMNIPACGYNACRLVQNPMNKTGLAGQPLLYTQKERAGGSGEPTCFHIPGPVECRWYHWMWCL